jgi:hypothetical protein
MHVLFEGLFQLEISLLISNGISEGYLSLAFLNERISSLSFHFSCSNDKFSTLESSEKFNFTAAQMWSFAIHLPVLIGDTYPSTSQHWSCFILLLQISQILTSPTVPLESITSLERLIKDHHALFYILYPEKVIPKLHFLIHFPHQMRQFGPARFHWCYRMESYHQIAKYRHYNFKNLCFSVCKRYSLFHSSNLFDDHGRPKSLDLKFIPAMPCIPSLIHYEGIMMMGHECSTAMSGTVIFKKGSYVAARIIETRVCRIEKLFVTVESNLFMEICRCDAQFDEHLNVHVVVSESQEREFISYYALVYPWPLIHVITSDRKIAIIFKSFYYPSAIVPE